MKQILMVSITIILLATAFALSANTSEKTGDMPETTKNTAQALFAGGCFWCMEKPFEVLGGVLSVTSGYAGGSTANPTYRNYGRGGHIEVVQILYDPIRISYGKLLDTFWRQIDPTDDGGQFVDRGHEYISAIFVYNVQQRMLAEVSKEKLAASGILKGPVVTAIYDAPKFWPAEGYHQDYYKVNPVRYSFYRSRSGRDNYLKKTWSGVNIDLSGEETKEDLKKKLTALQYKVTQEEGTEPPFSNEYWDNKKAGLYVDIVSGEPLFSSIDKFDSGTGWPSFTKPVDQESIVLKTDRSLFSVRTEVRSKKGDSHLGHVFSDGPPPAGLRYCINSAALRFVPVNKLVDAGYQEFLPLFK